MNTSAAPGTPPAISITIVLYNSADSVRSCVNSIAADLRSGFAELIAVDNASPDYSVQIVQRAWPAAKLVRVPQNLGFAGGCNLAWPHVRGRYWMLLNPDVLIPVDGLRKLVEWMDEYPSIGAASPQLMNAQGESQATPRRFLRLSRTLLELFRLHRFLPAARREDLMLETYWRGADHLDVDWVPGTALIARKQAVEQAGLLSDDFFMYGEDIEWCWRIKRAGWRVGFCDGVNVYHAGGTSAASTWSSKERSEQMLRGTFAAYRRMYGTLHSWLLLTLRTFAVAIESIHPGRSAQHRAEMRAALAGHWHVMLSSQ